MADENKPLPASAKKRGRLREQGSVVRSHDAVTVVVLGVTLFGLMYFGAEMGGEMATFMFRCFTELGKPEGHSAITGGIMPFLGGTLVLHLFLFLSTVGGSAILANLVQTGPMFVTAQFGRGLGGINPLEGIKKLFSMRKGVMSMISLIKLVIVSSFAYSAVKELWEAPVFSRPVNVQELGHFYQQAAWAVGWRVLIALMILAAVDYLYQKWQYEKDNKMSLQEVKDEAKNAEGSPEIKARQRGLMRRNRSMRRMLEDMSGATIVVTNPTHYAVALRYVRDVTPTPLILAKGIRLNAEAIKQRAAELNVPMEENVPLARGLYKHGEVGQPIPPLYYQAVAQVLSELFRRGLRRSP